MRQGEIAGDVSRSSLFPREEGSDVLVERIDRLIQARVEQQMSQVQPRVLRPGRRRLVGPSLGLALGSIGLAFPITGVTVSALQGPAALIALLIEWSGIAVINISCAWTWRSARLADMEEVAAPPAVPLPPPPAPPSLSPPPAPPAPPAPRPDPLARLPLAVLVKVEQIRRKAEVLLQHQGQFPMGSKNLYVLGRIEAEYLPSTIDAYLALSGDDRPVAPDGRTGLQVLRAQLELLDTKLDEIADDLQRANVDRLLANERFLEEHFSRGTPH